MSNKIISRGGSVFLTHDKRCIGSVERVEIDPLDKLHIIMIGVPQGRNFERHEQVTYNSLGSNKPSADTDLIIESSNGAGHYICRQVEQKYLFKNMKSIK